MRARYDMLQQRTRAELTGADRKKLGGAIEVLTNLKVCEQVDGEIGGCCNDGISELECILAAYPVKSRECDESKAKVPAVDTRQRAKGDS